MRTFKILVILGLIFLTYSCCKNNNNCNTNKDTTANILSNKSEKSLPEFAGLYKLPTESGDLELTISKENSIYNYHFKGDAGKFDSKGTLSISNDTNELYLIFEGVILNKKPKTIEAIYSDETITIQNSGNAQQGGWVIFTFCDEKYLELKKVK